MSEILNKIRHVDPNDSDAAKEVVSAFFLSLAKSSGFENNKWLRSLEFVISRYPRYCMTHRNTVENFVIKYLDSNNYNNVIEVARSAHSLQQVRPSQEKVATPKTCWREQMNTLCHVAHKLISSLFTKTVDLYQNGDNLQLQSLANSPLTNALLKLNKFSNIKTEDKLAVLSIRIRNIFVFIQAMLVETYPVAKAIRPQTIIDVIVRTLSVTSGKNVGNSHNLVDICMIKIQALRTLDALGACLGSNLLPYSALVIRLPMQTLRWSSENVSDDTRKVRCAAYQSIRRWLTIVRASSDSGRWHDEITTHMLDDVVTKGTAPVTVKQCWDDMNDFSSVIIVPVQSKPKNSLARKDTMFVNLRKMTAQPSLKNLSKKAKRKIQNTMLQQSTLAAHMSTEKNKIQCTDNTDDSVAIIALDCAENFLTVCGAFLKPTIHKQFHERIIRECFTYNCHDRRLLGLLRVLDATWRSCRNVPPPTQYCLALYSKLVNSENEEISKICLKAIQEIRLHLHCSPPSLNFALEPRKEDTTTKNIDKSISERNRAALESLLGKTVMPERLDFEEEPMPKRLKHTVDTNEDITEQISLSSDSVKSVVISDDSDAEITEDIEIVESAENHKELDKLAVEADSENYDLTKNKDNDVPNYETIVEDQTKPFNIYEAKTQIPVIDSNDTIDSGEMALSNEVGYDLPNTVSKTKVLEKMEDENLPSTNETDDIQITCGQLIKSSQDANKKDENTPKVNGFTKSPEKEIEMAEENLVPVKTVEIDAVSVDDMLADFVDEVNDDINVED